MSNCTDKTDSREYHISKGPEIPLFPPILQGYCDVFQKCRAVDAEGPLARLKNLLFNQDTLNSVAEWITVSVPLCQV